jgi:hypothetical protein
MSTDLRGYLETQSNRAEEVLAAHDAPATITGETIGPVADDGGLAGVGTVGGRFA